MEPKRIAEFIKESGQPDYRLKQIFEAVFQQGMEDWQEISNLPQKLRQKLAKKIPILSFKLEKILMSKSKKVFKALVVLGDGLKIETVLLNPKPDLWSCCLSTQVGCQMGCRFCATGKMGFKRNLTAEEITDQVLFWRQYMKKNRIDGNLTHVVFMGMGEPLANQKNLFVSLRYLMDPNLFGIGQRNLSVSTSGFVPGIKDLAEAFPQVNLAVSVPAANNKLRSFLMPMNKGFSLEKLMREIKKYLKITNRKVFVEYILFDGLNDQKIHAQQLTELISKIGKTYLLHVNLIGFNQTGNSFQPPNRQTIRQFKHYLCALGVKATIRKSLGQDIEAACGQLATKN